MNISIELEHIFIALNGIMQNIFTIDFCQSNFMDFDVLNIMIIIIIIQLYKYIPRNGIEKVNMESWSSESETTGLH